VRKYPTWRVLVFFSICPAVGGVFCVVALFSKVFEVIVLEGGGLLIAILTVSRMLIGSIVLGMFFYLCFF